eukprot:scaffold97763_cov33-Tisochrysis_lutea.AAC.7
MAAMLLTALFSPSFSVLRGASRVPVLSSALRSRGGATLLSAPPPAAVPLSEARVESGEVAVAEWKGDLLLLPCWEADEAFELPAEVRRAWRDP